MPRTVSDQVAIVQKLDGLSSELQGLRDIYQRKLVCLTEMKQAVLRKAFAGELAVPPEKVMKQAAE